MSETLTVGKKFAKAFVPMYPVLIAYVLWMPVSGSPSFGDLALHQQIIASTSLPAMLWSMWRFHKYVKEERQTPEERILEGER